MSSSRIDNASATTTVQVDQTRARQTATPATPFKDVLQGGASALLTGAEVAGGAIGGPVVAAAIRQARTGVEGTGTGTGTGPGGTGVAGTGDPNFNPNSELGQMFALQRESQQFNMQMLALQENVQQENRRFSTLTNVVRARHDTAKAATANVRA